MNDWQKRRRQRDELRRTEVMALPILKVRHHAAVAAAQDGDVLVSESVGPKGEVIALWSTAEDLVTLTSTTTQPGWAPRSLILARRDR